MRRIHLAAAIASSALGATAAVAALLPAVELSERIDAYVQPFLDDGHLSGHLLVAQAGEVVYERSFGQANFELGVPVTRETLFNVGSISKVMTAIIGLQLIERDILAMDDRLSQWITDFPRGEQITMAHLFRHQAGIPHRVTDISEESQPRTAADLTALAKRATLLFDPGTDTSYSSGGYTVAARVLEIAGGASYEELLHRYVLEPSGMIRSLHPVGSALIPNRADSYRIGADGTLRNTALKHYSYLVGAGSIFSTARELLALQRALLNGAFGESALESWLRDGDLRWNGRTNGFRAFADYHGESGVSVILTSNLLTGAADRIRADVPRIAAGERVEPPRRLAVQAVSVPHARLASYEGVYQLRPGTEFELSLEDGELRLSGWTLIPVSQTSFFSPQDYARVRVVVAEDGTVERLDWEVGGDVHPMPRVAPLSHS